MKFALGYVILFEAFAYIKIFSPMDLQDQFTMKYPNGLIPASIGNFGNPLYGRALTGNLIVEHERDLKACGPLEMIDESVVSGSFVLMVDSGDCAFVAKVRNAQNIGAKAVIIVYEFDEDVENFVMGDNGSAGNLDIPGLLISKEDGTTIRDYVSGSRYTDITLTISFDTNKSRNKSLSLLIYTQSTSESLLNLLIQLSPYLHHFPDLTFTPHYFIFECKACKESNFKSIKQDCISGGRYCSYDPDGSSQLEGKDTVIEDLRQICLHKTVGKFYQKWFIYIQYFYRNCFKTFDKNCVKTGLETAGVDVKSVEKCMEDSVEGHDIELNDNKLMREEKNWYDRERIPFNPAIVINNLVYRGDLEVELVVQAICASYYYEFQPDYCKGVKEEVVVKKGRDWFLWAVILAGLCIVAGTLVVYRLWVRKEIKDDLKKEISHAVSSYFELAEMSRD